MKNLLVIFLFVLVISCKKEKEITLLDYCGTYSLESTTIKFVLNNSWICYTGMDSLEAHQADSLAALEPDFYIDTIYSTDTLTILPSPNSEKEIIVVGMFKAFYIEEDSLIFYNPLNTTELIFLNSLNWSSSENYTAENILKEDEIFFNFKIYHSYNPTTLTYIGIAKKLK